MQFTSSSIHMLRYGALADTEGVSLAHKINHVQPGLEMVWHATMR